MRASKSWRDVSLGKVLHRHENLTTDTHHLNLKKKKSQAYWITIEALGLGRRRGPVDPMRSLA